MTNDELDRGAISSCDQAPDNKDDHGADDGADQPRAFTGLVPADRLPEVGGDERAHDSQDGGQDEARRFIWPGMEKLGNNPGNEADDDSPDDAHDWLLFLTLQAPPTRRRWSYEKSAALGMRPSGVYLSTASGRFLESRERISSRDRPVCCDRVCSTSGPIACSNCGGAICLLGPDATQESAASPWPCCLKASINSRRPPLKTSPMLAPPSIPPRFPGVAAPAPPWGTCPGAAGLGCAPPRSISAILSRFWYPAMARSPSSAVMEGYPRLISSSSLSGPTCESEGAKHQRVARVVESVKPIQQRGARRLVPEAAAWGPPVDALQA